MDSSTPSRLTPLQDFLARRLLGAEPSFYLTGGAALAGFHLLHRQTDDIDLFTADRTGIERARRTLQLVAEEAGGKLDFRQDTPGFVRAVLTVGGQAVVVDLVYEPVAQRVSEKPVIDGIRVDPPEEILANKLAALVGRSELRDLIDVYRLEQAGYSIEDALPWALKKDGGATPAVMAWTASQVRIPESAPFTVDGLSAEILRSFRDDLIERLRRLALPT